MSFTEDGVVNLFKDGIHSSGSRVSVPGYTMQLNSLSSCYVKSIVDILQEILFHDIVGIQYECDVVDLELWQVQDGVLQGFGLRALFEVGCQQCDGILCQTHVGHLVLMVGDHRDIEHALGVGLSQDGDDRMLNDCILLVGR